MHLKSFTVNHCKGCACVWKIPIEARKALDDIIACRKKRCPFAKDDTWEWYYTLTEILGSEIPEYPEDPNEDLPEPIEGYNHVSAYKAAN